MTTIDTEAAALMLGITPNAVRILAHRHPDRLPRRGRDTHGRTLYAVEDVERIIEARLEQSA